MAATFCLMMTSCGNPISKIKSLTEDVENNANDWTDADQWVSFLEDMASTTCDFLESDFTEDELLEFGEAMSDLVDALRDVDDSKAEKAARKAGKTFEKNKEMKKRLEKAEKKAKKHAKDMDIDEDDLREAFRFMNLL